MTVAWHEATQAGLGHVGPGPGPGGGRPWPLSRRNRLRVVLLVHDRGNDFESLPAFTQAESSLPRRPGPASESRSRSGTGNFQLESSRNVTGKFGSTPAPPDPK